MVLQHVDYDEDEVEVALKLVKEKDFAALSSSAVIWCTVRKSWHSFMCRLS